MLKGVTLTVHAAELVAVVGASGVGKSTLLHVLGALDRPTAGSVWFRGQDLFARSEAELTRFRREEVGFVFQLYNLLADFTALENAMLPALIQRRPAAEARGRAMDALREVGLLDRVAHRPGELSGGEQQRVALARALVGRPAMILADEPTGNLDPKTSEVIFDLFARLQAERGRGLRHRHPQPRPGAARRPRLPARGRARDHRGLTPGPIPGSARGADPR